MALYKSIYLLTYLYYLLGRGIIVDPFGHWKLTPSANLSRSESQGAVDFHVATNAMSWRGHWIQPNMNTGLRGKYLVFISVVAITDTGLYDTVEDYNVTTTSLDWVDRRRRGRQTCRRMGSILSLVEFDAISLPKYRYDDDATDRFNRILTVAILVLFSLIVTSTQYVGEPISCWTPAHFEDDHEDYTNRLAMWTHIKPVYVCIHTTSRVVFHLS